MSLKSTVKVGRITNLSDARYCAGMGVEMLGFRVIEHNPDYIAPKTYQEIRGWFTGPEIVAEVEGLTDPETLESILTNYQPSMLEISLREWPMVSLSDLPLIIRIGQQDLARGTVLSSAMRDRIRYIILPSGTPESSIRLYADTYPVLLSVTNAEINPLLELPIEGFVLDGSAEDKPGLKDYSLLADVFDILDQDE
jgi:phosphoribosylanthranilate isomerase